MASEKTRVVVIEDNDVLLKLITRTLERAGIEVYAGATGAEGIAAVCQHPDAVVVLDYLLPDMNGLMVLKSIQEQGASPPVIAMTAFGDEQVAVALLKAGATEYLVKDDRAIAQLPQLVQRVAGDARLKKALDASAQALRQSEERYRRIVETANEGICSVDADFVIIQVNERMAQMLGYTVEELVGRSMTELVHPQEHAEHHMQAQQRRQGVRGTYERRFVRRDGVAIWCRVSAAPMWGAGGEFEGSFAMLYDISDAKRSEEDERRNQERLQSLLRIHQHRSATVQELVNYALGEAIALSGSTAGYVYSYSEKSHQFTLYAWSNEASSNCSVAKPPAVCELADSGVLGECVRLRKETVAESIDSAGPLKSGQVPGQCRLLAAPVLSEEQIVAVVGVVGKSNGYTQNDVVQLSLLISSVWALVEKIRAQEQIRESTAKYQELFELGSEAILLVDNQTGRIIEANKAASDMYGLSHEQLLAMRNVELSAEPEQTREVTGSTPVGSITIPLRWHLRNDGSKFPVEITGRFFAFGDRPVHVAAIRDISARYAAEQERERLAEQLRQAQKLESVGQLAGGVAHDFNNILNGIVGFLALLRKRVDPGSKGDEYAQRIHDLAMRAAGLTRQLLAFARKARVEMKPARVNGCVERVVDMLKHTIDKRIVLRSELPAESPVVIGDEAEIEHALLNMAINARDAMPDGGTLTFGVTVAALDNPESVGWADGKAGQYVWLRVTDTGAGMSSDTIERIFEPFFTTKAPGQGSGLGLSSVYGVVKQHGGHIIVTSAPGVGSTFTVLFPLATHAWVAEEPVPRAKALPAATKVLLVDDEAPVRDSIGALFADAGISVRTCSNGAEAVDVMNRNPDCCDVVVLDLMMPVMDGAECFRRLRGIRPELPVVLATGFGDPRQQEGVLKQPRTAMVAKPYDFSALVDAIDRLLRG